MATAAASQAVSISSAYHIHLLTNTQATMAPAAPTRTFAVFELAEAIFLELPMRDLLVHQRTCKQWQAVMAESSKLQEAMFFKPATPRALIIHEGRGGYGNFLIRHPLVRAHMRPLEDPTGALERADASWRRQLITHPPVAEVYACLSGGLLRADSSVPERKKTITARGAGVTMGQVAGVFGDYEATRVRFRNQAWWMPFTLDDMPAYEQVEDVKGLNYDGLWTWKEDEESESDEEELDAVDGDAL